jgi:hypothetical protein
VGVERYAADPVKTILSVVLSVSMAQNPGAAQPSSQRLNAEPLVMGVVGGVLVGLGIWRIISASSDLQALIAVDPSDPQVQANAMAVLREARLRRNRGIVDEQLGASLVAMGGALVAGALVWFLLEGPMVKSKVALVPGVAVSPGGASLSLVSKF